MTRLSRHERLLCLFAVLGVAWYVATWFILGLVRDDYVPTQQAISELFDLGAPAYARIALSVALVVTGVALATFGPVLHRHLPGTSRLGPALLSFSGVMTAAVVPFPCTATCPGMGASFTDTMHVLTAGSGYVALVTAPIAVGWRIRHDLPRLGRWSMVLGAAALVGFIVRNAGVDDLGGLQQRIFNTTADVWIALMGAFLLRRDRDAHATDRQTSVAHGSQSRDR